MVAIISSLRKDRVFDPEAIRAMSVAFDDICAALNVSESASAAREVIAERVIELAQRGERDPVRIREKVLAGAGEPGRSSDCKTPA